MFYYYSCVALIQYLFELIAYWQWISINKSRLCVYLLIFRCVLDVTNTNVRLCHKDHDIGLNLLVLSIFGKKLIQRPCTVKPCVMFLLKSAVYEENLVDYYNCSFILYLLLSLYDILNNLKVHSKRTKIFLKGLLKQ